MINVRLPATGCFEFHELYFPLTTSTQVCKVIASSDWDMSGIDFM